MKTRVSSMNGNTSVADDMMSVPDTTPSAKDSSRKRLQKKFIEDVRKGDIKAVKEKAYKGIDPNFWSENEETPLTVAVLNNDKEMIEMLIEIGAFLDYRVGGKDTWKTPLHIAAMHNKPTALQVLYILHLIPIFINRPC